MLGLSAAWVCGALSSFVPIDPSLLAPGPDTLASRLALAEERISSAEAIGRALARLHNRFAESQGVKRPGGTCAGEELASLALRARVFGRAHRDATQAARAEGRRLRSVLQAPTVVPVLDEAAKRRSDGLLERINRELARWNELRAWHHRFVEPVISTCAARAGAPAWRATEPAPAAGIAPSLDCAAGECPPAVAILALGTGRVCPSGQVAWGRVVIVRGGVACVEATGGAEGRADASIGEPDATAAPRPSSGCSCAPAPVLPAAVLAPAPAR